MDPRARSAYRAIAWGFLAVAAAVLLVQLGERVIGFDFFNGSPFPVALFLGGIGGLLLWTARSGDGDGDAPAEPSRRAPFELRDLGSVRPSGGAIDGIPPEMHPEMQAETRPGDPPDEPERRS